MKNYALLKYAVIISLLNQVFFILPCLGDAILPNASPSTNAGFENSAAQFFGPSVSTPTLSSGSYAAQGVSANASSSVSTEPFPSLSSYANSVTSGQGTNGIVSAQAATDAEFEYAFEVSGPAGNVLVPLLVTASGTSTSTNLNSGELSLAAFNVVGPVQGGFLVSSHPLISDATCSGQIGSICENGTFETDNGVYGTLSSSFSINSQLIDVLSNTIYEVNMLTEASADAGFISGSNGIDSAYVDPTFAIDPSFSDIGEYTLVFSPGVGNSPAAVTVPEPASFALMGSGLAGMGVAVRRRRARWFAVK